MIDSVDEMINSMKSLINRDLHVEQTNICVNNARQYAKNGDHSGAVLEFSKAIALTPNNVILYIERGFAYLELFKLDKQKRGADSGHPLARKALHDYKSALSMDKQKKFIVDIKLLHAEYNKLVENKFTEALNEYQQVVELCGDKSILQAAKNIARQNIKQLKIDIAKRTV
jgi:tetratricopeptide (TPR) repeat protein